MRISNNKGKSQAIRVLKDSGIYDMPLSISIEELAYSRGVARVQKIKIDGAQGWITGGKNTALISYSDSITNKAKKRFVIAHEIGHFELHEHLLNSKRPHTDTKFSLNNWYAKGKHEMEANDFASEILMPSHLFKRMVRAKPFNFDLISEVASSFETSMTASVIKYQGLGDFPIAIIFTENKEVKWSSFSEDFHSQYIPKGMNVPEFSVANDFYVDGILPDEPEEVSAMEWFCEDRNIENFKDITFYEQCIQIGENGVLSCIWND